MKLNILEPCSLGEIPAALSPLGRNEDMAWQGTSDLGTTSSNGGTGQVLTARVRKAFWAVSWGW